MSLLISLEEAEFSFIKDKTGASSGNISVQLNKLKEANYIDINKRFKNNYPQTMCKITTQGVEAFEKYVSALQSYVAPVKNDESP